MDGVKLLERQPNALTYEVQANMDRFLRAAVDNNVQDIETLPVTLEEVFLAYYGEGKLNND